MKSVGIAIAGGGIKSFAAIGTLQYLAEQKIPISAVSGTSMGSVIASLVACGATIEEIKTQMLELEAYFEANKIVSPTLLGLFQNAAKEGYVNSTLIEELLEKVFLKYQVKNIKDVRLPLAIPAVDLISGKLILFTNRKTSFLFEEETIIEDDISLAKAVAASCSFPLMFQPERYKDMQLVDGGLRMNVPIYPLQKMKMDYVISITMTGVNQVKEYRSMAQISKRVFDLLLSQSTLLSVLNADLNINIILDTDNPFNVSYGKEAIEKGYLSTKEYYGDKLASLKKKKWLFW